MGNITHHNKRQGVLLVNLGTPNKATVLGVKKFLGEFLRDKRVVDVTPWLWFPFLYAVLLPIRAKKIAKLYQNIWMEKGSPLMVYSQSQVNQLRKRLKLPVELGMTYGSPSLKSGIEKLMLKNVEDIIILPLYPQYSRTTTAAVMDALSRVFKQIPVIPSCRFISGYHDHTLYVQALVASVKQFWKKNNRGDYLLCSYHGIPESYAVNGDIYPKLCKKTTSLLARELGLNSRQIGISYQSRLGRGEWLKPYTDKMLKELYNNGIKKIDVLTPGFASDCLETLEEVSKQYKKIYIEAGGVQFNFIPCLNDSSLHIEMMMALVTEK
ncbi:ferrochelatase [Candidatus Photodesmus blepharus]|uniref:Ferrochelatase n=1 Tax=Candidatus Photodesmus blepharonis TaxID=1179155 RepID=A0A084CMP0_9GAMM|nr:ferrochelatase [Candidatus Photodesmus blepharus]KEY91069.1 ferrochelatase [Candidatus Photodesmus blepharus]